MNFFTLLPLYDNDGDTVYRSIGVSSGDRRVLTNWLLEHQKGREHTRSSFKPMMFEWRDSHEKRVCDFPPSSDNIFSAAAISVLRKMLEASGDLYSIKVELSDLSYYYFDCWEYFNVERNAEFNFLDESTWKFLLLKGDVPARDVFSAYLVPGLIVSERFKNIVEENKLSGFCFRPIEVLAMET